jgi:hypothetical protein
VGAERLVALSLCARWMLVSPLLVVRFMATSHEKYLTGTSGCHSVCQLRTCLSKLKLIIY